MKCIIVNGNLPYCLLLLFEIWHTICFDILVMDIEKINRKHSMETDMYYKVGFGLSSKLLSYRNGVFSLEVVLGKKWKKDYNSTAIELANCWKNTHRELAKAIACKVFIVDPTEFGYKQYLIHKGIRPGYDARKGVIFNKDYLN